MSLKLFRSTGYSSILAPGPRGPATHPGWVVLAVSAWIGFACNVALWRGLRAMAESPGLGRSLTAGAFIAGACGAILSLLGWRRTLKRAATFLLLVAALGAACLWVQARPLDSSLLDQGLRSVFLPAWPSLLRWQFPVLLIVLGLVPMFWLWQLPLRRLPGPKQFKSNLTGMVLGVLLMAGSAVLLSLR
ncbi:MAG: hypothetical protein NVS3B2_02040 [Ramlibacter sp.]